MQWGTANHFGNLVDMDIEVPDDLETPGQAPNREKQPIN
jgi:hypothetical protein